MFDKMVNVWVTELESTAPHYELEDARLVRSAYILPVAQITQRAATNQLGMT